MSLKFDVTRSDRETFTSELKSPDETVIFSFCFRLPLQHSLPTKYNTIQYSSFL
jgi:hypothetical protein